jgi:hypothetical protein
VSSGMLCHVAFVRTDVPPKRRFLQEPHGVTSKKTPFFIVTVVKTSNLIYFFEFSSFYAWTSWLKLS